MDLDHVSSTELNRYGYNAVYEPFQIVLYKCITASRSSQLVVILLLHFHEKRAPLHMLRQKNLERYGIVRFLQMLHSTYGNNSKSQPTSRLLQCHHHGRQFLSLKYLILQVMGTKMKQLNQGCKVSWSIQYDFSLMGYNLK